MRKYKITTQNMTTHNGHPWEVGVEQTVLNPTAELCSPGVFHFYDSPEIAVLMNPIHANIANPRLFAAEIDRVVIHDGTKGGCHGMTLVLELPLPTIDMATRLAFGIFCALEVYPDADFSAWAAAWMDGSDRSRAAGAAWEAAEAAAGAAAGAAAEAAEAAAEAAAGAAGAAAEAAAGAAEAAAEAAAGAAEAAAGAAEAAKAAAGAAARAAAGAAAGAAENYLIPIAGKAMEFQVRERTK